MYVLHTLVLLGALGLVLLPTLHRMSPPRGTRQRLSFRDRLTFVRAQLVSDRGDVGDDADKDKDKGGGADADKDKGGSQDKGTDADKDRGFPADTPVAEMTLEQREAYWRYQARKHEERGRGRADYDDLKAKAEKWDAAEREKQTPAEQAIADAEKRGRESATTEANEKAATAILRANLTARGWKKEDVDEAMPGFNPAGFVVDGEVDTDKVVAFANRIAGTGTGGGSRWPDTGQGHRPPTGSKGVSAGAERFAARRGKTKTS